jgi:S1-C subfamily serine protease
VCQQYKPPSVNLSGDTPMTIDRFHSPLAAHLAAFSGTLGLGIVIALAYGAADAQQSTTGTAQKATGQPVTAPQGQPGTPRKEAARDAKRARRQVKGLGVQLEAKGDQGLLVSSLEDNGVAARAGLQQNDRIISVDSHAINNPRQFNAYLASHGGRRVPLVIDRNGQRVTVEITPPMLGGDTAWLGVFLDEGDSNVKGARITQVYPSGPAARGGLHPGDTIVSVDGQKIEGSHDLVMLVQEMEPRSTSEFVVVRNNQETKIPVTFGSRDSFQAANPNAYGSHSTNYGPQDQNGQNGQHEHSEFDDVPPHAMSLENDRRNAEQHQRIEEEIRLLREEIKQLREELKQRK